jgi:folate-binding Fe-S cluster repair protein YgfZ
MAEYEYDYIPPNQGSRPFVPTLPSVFDVSVTPAGMRGEAVRSALRSGRCICFDLGDSPFQQGWIKLEGKGVMDFLSNKMTQSFDGRSCYKEACLLTAKGRVIDLLGVAVLSSECAYLLTSPGHKGKALFDRLDPLIFPMDQIKLKDCSKSSRIITLASTKTKHAQAAIEKYVLPLCNLGKEVKFPEKDNNCIQWKLESDVTLTLLSTVNLPRTAASGFTLVIENDAALSQMIRNNLVGEGSPEGPIEIGALEYDTLRIEAGMPLFGYEITGSDKDAEVTPAGPLELHLDKLIDKDKGCYLGQEGVASVLKNSRGPPRLLYQVIFDYEGNVFDSESQGDKGNIENLTQLPVAGAELFVLGSQNEILVGTLTSIAEPSGTGDPNMVGLVLARRPDSILKAMRERGLEIDRNVGKDPFENDPLWNGGNVDVSAMVPPPPMDPLDGLEVVVKDSFTVGILRSVPTRRYPLGQNMFEDIVIYDAVEPGQGEVEINRIQKRWSPEMEAAIDALFEKQQERPEISVGDVDPELEETGLMSEAEQAELDLAMEEAATAQAAAEAAAAEAKRKADKIEMLKKRAEEAIARRKAKKDQQGSTE